MTSELWSKNHFQNQTQTPPPPLLKITLKVPGLPFNSFIQSLGVSSTGYKKFKKRVVDVERGTR